VVRHQAALVAAHAEVVDQQGAGGGWVGGGIEGALERVEKAGYIAVEIADFAGYRADDLGLVGWEMGEGLGAFRMLDLGGFGC
jgi:hypothetical protein